MIRFLMVTLGVVMSFVFCMGQNPDNGLIRCSSVEYNENLRLKYPELGTVEDFEKWMKVKKTEMSAENRMVTTYTIPVIFHVIHNGEAEGATRNVSQFYIDEQLRQLNEDFANLSGSTDPVAADTEIQFCAAVVDPTGALLPQPGINRKHRNDYGFSAPSWTSGYVDGTIKPASQWDPDQYCNIWVLDLSGSLLGWAQFPSNTGLGGLNNDGGAANTDGVVILHSSVGSITNPFGGGNSAYDNGRTLTHEIGHWVGLRHIWGDGGCGVDDFCNDTPESDASNFGCPNHTSCGTTDMVENYMDYTDDDCMNIFTGDQKLRMHVVFDPANGVPRRALLPSSTVCTSDPVLAFTTTGTSVIEGTDCGYTNYQIEVSITNSGSSSVSGVISVDGSSTATNGIDYLGGAGVVTFPAGSTTPQNVNINIAEDGVNELGESVVLKIVSTTGGALIGGNDTHTVGISDDDPMPGAVTMFPYENQDFNAGVGAWTTTDGGSTNDTWFLTNNGGSNIDGTDFMFCDSDAAGSGSTTYEVLLSPVVNTLNATSLTLDFDQYFRAYNVGYDEQATVEVFDGTNWINIYTHSGNSGGDIGAWGAPITTSIPVTAYVNANFQVRFTYDAEWDYYWAIDNVTLIGDYFLPIETVVNSGGGFMNVDFGPNQTIHFMDENSGNLMLTLENLSGHNYGCTDVEIDRAGTTSYGSPAPEAVDIIDKNFIVTPEFNNLAGSYNVTLYYTNEEVTGFEGSNSLGSTKADLFMVKSADAVSASSSLELTATAPVAYGTDWQFTGTYSTGFSGIALGNQTVVPVRLISFEAFAQKESIDLVWKTAGEINNKGFEVWRGTSESNMTNIGFVDGSGTSQSELRYDFSDENVEKGTLYYYRLKQIDFDGQFDESEIRTARIVSEKDYLLSPNPVSDQLTITIGEDILTEIEVYDLKGQKVLIQKISLSTEGVIELDVSSLSRGAYFIVFKNASSILKHDRFVKI